MSDFLSESKFSNSKFPVFHLQLIQDGKTIDVFKPYGSLDERFFFVSMLACGVQVLFLGRTLVDLDKIAL